jgi:hypothetical protein
MQNNTIKKHLNQNRMDAYIIFLIVLPIWGISFKYSGLLDKYDNKL